MIINIDAIHLINFYIKISQYGEFVIHICMHTCIHTCIHTCVSIDQLLDCLTSI